MAEDKDPELEAFDLDARPPEPLDAPWDDGPEDPLHPLHGSRCEACGCPASEGCMEDCPLWVKKRLGDLRERAKLAAAAQLAQQLDAAERRAGLGEYFSLAPTYVHDPLYDRDDRVLRLEQDLCHARNVLRELYQAAYDDSVMGVPRTEERLKDAVAQAYKYLNFVGLPPDGQNACCRCGKTQHTSDGTPVTWLCACNGRVCRNCALINPRTGAYYDETFCSYECWTKAGCPEP